MTTSAQTPFDILLDYEQRSLRLSRTLPATEQIQDEWVGIGFRLGEEVMLVPMADVVEILDPLQYTKVPGAQTWFLGIANVRGNLLPVTDLHAFVYGGRAISRRNSRILVFNRNGVYAGLKVDDVLGIKRFYMEELDDARPTVHDRLKPYTDKAFKRLREQWPILRLEKFIASREFVHIAKVA